MVSLVLVSEFAVFRLVPCVKAQAETPSTGITFADIPINYTQIWQKINQHSAWDLEWYNATALQWVSVKSDLQIEKAYINETACKISLIFDASQAGNYRLTFAIDVRVREYVTKLDKHQYELTYDDFTIIFDWSDIASISGIIITHGMKEIVGEKYF